MDLTLNLQAAAAFLTASATSAGAGGGDPLAGAAGDGTSFSEILAQTSAVSETEGTVEGNGVHADAAENADNTVAEDVVSDDDMELDDGMMFVPKASLMDLIDIINNSDNGIKKGMRLLFETMIKAFTGDSTKDKKTDLFSVLSGGNGLFDDDTFLFGAEFMYQFGTAMDMELIGGTDEDDVMDALDLLLDSLFGSKDDDETDENTVADILASLVSPEVRDELVYLVQPEEELTTAQITAELFKLPKEVIREEKPEAVPEMEKLYDEFRVEIEVKPETEPDIRDTVQDIRNMMAADRSAVRVNDAADQIRLIGGEEAVPAIADEDNEDILAQSELAAAVQNTVPAESASETAPTEFDAVTARSVENQITERITEKLIDIKEDNGTEEMVMVLKPENLGQVAVKLIKENGALSVILSAQYEEVGKLMTERAAALSDSLSNRNVEVKDIAVVDPSNAAEQMGLNFTNQGFNFGRGQEYSSDGEKNSYISIDGIDEDEETGSEINIIREARLWQAMA